MFPIPFNFPYRKKDGSITTLEKAIAGGGTDLDLTELDDVGIENPVDGELFEYDGTTGKWKNSSIIPDKLDNEIKTRAKNGAHNLGINHGTNQTIKTVVFTVNSDKSVTLSDGSVPSGDSAQFTMSDRTAKNFMLKAGTYRISGGNDANNNGLFIGIGTGNEGDGSTGSWVDLADTHNGEATFTLSSDKYVAWYIVASGETSYSTPKTVYPMIKLATDPDSTYAPYAMTNRELTELTGALATGYGNVAFQKVGREVIVNGFFQITSDIATNTNVMQIPSGYNPIQNMFVMVNRISDGATRGLVANSSDGYIKTGDQTLPTGYWAIVGCWFV